MNVSTGANVISGMVSLPAQYLSHGLTHVFGPQIQGAILGQITWADLIVAAIPILLVAALNVALSFIFHRQVDQSRPIHNSKFFLCGSCRESQTRAPKCWPSCRGFR